VTDSALAALVHWLEQRLPALEVVVIAVSLTWGPEDGDPRSAWVDFETDQMSARLIVWDNGLADLTVGDLVEGEVPLEEHRQVHGSVGLDDVEATVRAWFLGEG